MKKISQLTCLLIMTLGSQLSFAQKSVYADLTTLSSSPQYQAAQAELDQLSLKWKNEIEAKSAKIKELRNALDLEVATVSPEMKAKRESEINIKSNEMNALLEQYFGVNGDIFKKRNELIKSLQS